MTPVAGSNGGLFAHPKLESPDPTTAVFINCPFDSEYAEYRDAIVFAVVCCGLFPRIAESDKTTVPRLERILHGVYTSDYSIHDLSRFRGEGEELLARMNMPLELGLAIGRQFVADRLMPLTEAERGPLQELPRRHRWMLLVPEGAADEKFISDLRAYDAHTYANRLGLIGAVMRGLLAGPDAIAGLMPVDVERAFDEFHKEKVALDEGWGGKAPWSHVIKLAGTHVPRIQDAA